MLNVEANRWRVAPFLVAVVLVIAMGGKALAQTTPPARTPTETVREFYKALNERRFREALALSIFKPAIDALNQKEFEELRPYFEAMAFGSESVEITGEQISGNAATVFIRVKDDNGAMQPSKADLIRVNNVWIVGDTEGEKAVNQAGKNYFFIVRSQVNEANAEEMMVRILKAEFVYASQHAGDYTEIATLVKEGLLPQDILTTASTGYRYHVKLGKDNKTYVAGAEPAEYERTGKVSFYLDTNGLQKKDVGGKPLTPDKK